MNQSRSIFPAQLQTLEDEITACRACPRLVAWREQVARERRRAYIDQEYWGRPVPGFGDPQARVLIIGLAPGAHGSNRTGRMFTGDASGDFLYSALHRAGFASQPRSFNREDGLVLKDIFITAVCRCVPPGNKPSPDEMSRCLPYVQQEMALLPPLEGIVALGRIAFDNVLRLFPPDVSISPRPGFGHAAFYRLGENRPWLLASYHPSRQNTQTGRLTRAMFDQVWETVLKLLP
jgi:uracil-DNA glycosylase family 4